MELPDESQSRGTRIHAALETGDVSLLSEDEMEDWAKAVEYIKQAKEWWLGPIIQNQGGLLGNGGRAISVKEIKEKRLWLHLGLDPVLSGQPDVVYIADKSACVIDLKSGWNTHLTPSELNWQLRVLAVLVARNYEVYDVMVGFVKPKSRYQAIDVTRYGPLELIEAEKQILSTLSASNKVSAHRSPGPQCRYCPAKMRCPEAGSYSLLPSVVAGVSVGVNKADVEVAVQRLGAPDWKYIWERASVIRNILDAAGKCLKRLPVDDLKELGLQIGEGRRLDPIVNVIGAYKALEHQLPAQLLWQALSFEKGKLVEAAMAHHKMTKKDAEIWVRQQLEPFVEKKNSEGSLEEVT